MWKILFLSVVILAIAIAAMSIKMFLIKGGEFKKTCSSCDPHSGKPMNCSCGHGDGEADCKNKDKGRGN